MTLSVALIQPSSQNDPVQNLQSLTHAIREAAAKGATFILTPENALMMAGNAEELRAYAREENQHDGIIALQQLAASLHIYLLIGSVAVPGGSNGRLLNRSFFIGPDGNTIATYDKIHLYDATVKGGETHQESKGFAPGQEAVLAHTPIGAIGLTICYDLRFPQLFRQLAKAGAQIITVPSAFTQFTGEAHWHNLLRARAIENGCFILAPGQTGKHPRNRNTFGHSLVVDPWGTILADGGEAPGIVLAELDLNQVKNIREGAPSLQHDREFTLKTF